MRGRPAPPPHVIKQKAIRFYARQFGLKIFIETGTYLGEMVEAMRPHFREIYSIELSEELCARAREKFRGDPRVHILQGDSGEVLPSILERVEEPCLLWLDGHFSGGVTALGTEAYPILKELHHLRRAPRKDHVVLIDDARLFDGSPGVPSKKQIIEGIRAIDPAYSIAERDDIIRAFVDRS